jgi:sugar lactone lactonase YvrE
MQLIEAQVLFRPESSVLQFLPEGPYWIGDGLASWVAIQHGAESKLGSINVLDLAEGRNQTFELKGRPGFAFPTNQPGVFIAGVERQIGLHNTLTGTWTVLADDVDSDVDNTIINDGVLFENNILFGCKDLQFQTKKAGLYLFRSSDRQLIPLRNDQICSNGKAIIRNTSGGLQLFDIDSPTKTIVRYELDMNAGRLTSPKTIVDLTNDHVFPDGMILTPDHKSLIVALYDPGDPDFGAARQYSLDGGHLEAIWTCAGSPRVTCPQLVMHEGRVRLLLTTAVEHMTSEQLAKHPNAGCLFVGDTPFESLGDQPIFQIRAG